MPYIKLPTEEEHSLTMLKANEAHLSSQDTLPPPNTVAVKPTHSFAYRCIDPHLSHIRTYPEALTTSPIISSKALFWWRVLAALWIVAIIPFSLARGEQETYLFYFTHLTWLGLGTWFLVAAFQTYRYNRDGHMGAFTEQCKFTQFLTWNLYIMPATFHWIVPIVYWLMLSGSLIEDGDLLDWWTNVNVHAVDFLLIAVEFYLNSIPLFYSQWPAVIITGLTYLGYAFFQHGVYHNFDHQRKPNGWWVYGFLDTSKSSAVIYYVALPIGFVVVFCFVVMLHKVRDRRRSRNGSQYN